LTAHLLTRPRATIALALALLAALLLPPTAAHAAPGAMIQPASGSVTGIVGAHCDGTAHNGIDIARTSGGPIVAAAAGTVSAAVTSSGTSGYGTYVIIDHGNTYSTVYGHMIAGSLTVAKGSTVAQGDVIGQMGSTGNSTGTHLHFEVRINNVSQRGLNSVYACGQPVTRGAAIAWDFPNFASASSAQRVAVLQADGTLQVKEGVNGTWVTVSNDVVSYDIAGTRIGVVDSTGMAFVKEGGLNAMWTAVASNVSTILLDGSRIGVVQSTGNFSVKEGAVGATFSLVSTGVVQAELSGTRIAIRNGSNLIQAKEGGVGAAWVTLTTATDFDVSPTRVVVIDAAGNASVKAGGLNAGWQALSTNVSDVHLSAARIVIRTGGNLQAMDIAVGAWTQLTSGVSDFSVSDTFIGAVQGGSTSVKTGGLNGAWTLVATGTTSVKVTG
jgi:hypothetical protein